MYVSLTAAEADPGTIRERLNREVAEFKRVPRGFAPYQDTCCKPRTAQRYKGLVEVSLQEIYYAPFTIIRPCTPTYRRPTLNGHEEFPKWYIVLYSTIYLWSLMFNPVNPV